MRIRVISDLHLERDAIHLPEVPTDVVVLAGDIGQGTDGLDWAEKMFPGQHVIYVPGNHEYYNHGIPALAIKLRERAQGRSIHILDNEGVTIAGIRFLGSTLWTDYQLHGDAPEAMRLAASNIRDFKKIFDTRNPDLIRLLNPTVARQLHMQARTWLELELNQKKDATTVVVTHFAPSYKSIHQRYLGHSNNPSFASNMDSIVEQSHAAFWIHGHVHDPVDYFLGSTRVLCNPRGYVDRDDKNGFQPGLVVEVLPEEQQLL